MKIEVLKEIVQRIAAAQVTGRLDLQGLQLTELFVDISSPEKIQYVNLSSNNFSSVPDVIYKMKNLRVLTMNRNHLEFIPKRINELRELIRLDLNNNKIIEIEDGFGDLPRMTTLYLKNNYIKEIPASLRFAESLRVATFAKNQLDIPVEILDGPVGGLLNYLEAIHDGEVFCLREAKLLVVGEGSSGKTRLSRFIVTGHSGDPDTTEGIEISRLRSVSYHGEFNVNVWDFGGQEIYHSTHQYFLTKKSIYLFVWVARSDDDLSSFDFWLNTVSLLSDNSPILIVQNKIDERLKEIDRVKITKTFKNVVGFWDVSAKTGDGIENLRKCIIQQSQLLQHFNQKVPMAWVKIRDHLENLNKPYISYSEYLSICRQYSLTKNKAEWLSEYFNVLGVFLHFPDNIVLSDTLFLKPAWATNATYRLLDDKDVINSNGFLTVNTARQAWADYPQEKHVVLLELLKKFELCFELPGGKGYILPARLPVSPPDGVAMSPVEFEFYYEYEFMPAGIIERTVVRLSALIIDNFFWKGGAKFQKNEATAIVSLDRFKRRISIGISGQNKSDLLTIIRNEIDQINYSLNSPDVKEKLPCNCVECMHSEPYYFSYQEIQNAKARKRSSIECRKSFEQIDIQRLLGQIDGTIDTKERELVILLKKIADKFDDEESLAEKANEIFRLQPNFFGLGVNLNHVISLVLKGRKK